PADTFLGSKKSLLRGPASSNAGRDAREEVSTCFWEIRSLTSTLSAAPTKCIARSPRCPETGESKRALPKSLIATSARVMPPSGPPGTSKRGAEEGVEGGASSVMTPLSRAPHFRSESALLHDLLPSGRPALDRQTETYFVQPMRSSSSATSSIQTSNGSGSAWYCHHPNQKLVIVGRM